MKTKTQITKQILSIFMSMVLLLTFLPMTVFAALSPSTPTYITTSDGIEIYAKGTNLFIEEGTISGTAVYYYDGGSKVYLNPNGAKGDDLSTAEIFAGGDDSNLDSFDVSIVMTGGKVGTIYTAKGYGYLFGNVTIAVTGTAQVGLICCGSKYGPDNGEDHHGKNGSLAIYDTIGVTIDSGGTGVDGMIKKTDSGWEVRGKAVIPAGITMTIAGGETVTVPADASISNNGTLINNGTLELYGSVTGNDITGSGAVSCDTDYIENVSSVSSVSAKVNGTSVTLANGQYRLFGGKLYIWLTEGDAEVILNDVKYYGVIVHGNPIKLTTDYTAITSISKIPTEITAYVPAALSPETNTTTFAPQFTYEILSDGTTAAEARMIGNSLYASGEGTIKLKITASDGYTSYSKTFDITVKNSGYAASVSNGGIVITKHSDTQLKVTYSAYPDGYIIIDKDEPLLITGSSSSENYTIKVESGDVNIILKDCSVTFSSMTTPPFDIASGSTVTLSLAGTNKLTNSASYSNEGSRTTGINVPEGASLIIDGTGSLEVKGGENSAAIGTHYSQAPGTVIINGGTVKVTGGYYGAGIGSGGSYYSTENYAGGTITINGGTVNATGGSYGAGIGGGLKSAGGKITINGGVVNATGGGGDGAGIGGGASYESTSACGAGGTITINGGTITAESEMGAGIGGGGSYVDANGGAGGTITITGGTVSAKSTESDGGAGIGGGGSRKTKGGNGGTVTITGGNVKATGNGGEAIGKGYKGTTSGTLKDARGNNLTLSTITLDGAADGTAVTEAAGINYGLNDVKTLDTNKLYFYLPANSVVNTITAGGAEYFCADSDLTYYTSHDWSYQDGVCAYCGTNCNHAGQEGTCSICSKNLHIHEWKYELDGMDTIKATCTASNCLDTNGGSVTLNVSDAYYTGSAIGATVEGRFTNGATYKLTYNDDSDTVPSSDGKHTATLTVSENGTEKQSLTLEYEISYLSAPESAYTINGGYKSENTYWFKIGETVTVTAPVGFAISKTLGGTYSSSVTFSEGEEKTVYLKQISDGALTDVITISENIFFDGNSATGEITIENRGFWEKLLNKITFGLFFEGDMVAKVTAADTDSGVKSIQYYVANEDLIDDDTLDNAAAISKLEDVIDNNWNTYNNEIALNKNAKNVIYVKITDNVGNVFYTNTDGIVLYSDAEAVTDNVSITYNASEDQDVTVKLNGNKVKSVANGTSVLTAGTDYTVSADGTITLKADYLNKLNAGSYTFTVSYNPLGETYVEANGNDAPATTTFSLNVAQVNIANATVTVNGTFTYDGNRNTPDPVVVLDGVTLVKDRDYTISYSDNLDAGEATVTITGTGNYTGTANQTFTIGKIALTITADNKSKTYGENDPALTWSITSGALVNGEQLTGITAVREPGENVNTYDITVGQADGANKNYAIIFVDGILTINIKTVAATVTVNGGPFYYNTSEQKPEIVVKDGDTVIPASEYTVSYSNNTNAGTATVTITDKDDGNYTVSGNTTFTINKADPVIGMVAVSGVVKDTTKPSEVVLTRTDSAVDGVLSLDMADSEAMQASKSAYRWVFTPTDTNNYNVIKGDVQIDVLDTKVPTVVIKVDTNEWKEFLNNITFGLFFKDTQEVTITAADDENGSGLKDIFYFVSDKELSENDLATVEWKLYSEAFDIEPEGKFVIYAKISDNDGNAVIINSDGVVVDETAAVVSGVTDGETYYGQVVFTATDALAGIKKVEIDGKDETHFEGQYVIDPDNAQHTVTVTDNAGNVTEYKITVYKNYTVTYKADGEPVSTETVGHGKNATLPAVPAKYGYVGKWDGDGKNITGDITISAVYTAIPVVKPDEVKPEDKTDLEDTKAKLEEELNDDSYSDEDKKEIQDAIDGIDEALEIIGNVEEVEDLIDKPADSPQTGDNSNLWLWFALLFVSGAGIFGITLTDRKRKVASKR